MIILTDDLKQKPLFNLTVGEFLELQGQVIGNNEKFNKELDKKYVYSLAALAAELHCSVATVQKLKNSRKIPYKQAGRKVIFDLDAVMAALEKSKK